MSVNLSSDQLAFHLRLPQGSWDLHALNLSGVGIEEATMSARWVSRNRPMVWQGEMKNAIVSHEGPRNTPFGKSTQAFVRWSMPGSSLTFTLDCAMLLEVPLFLWRLHVENSSPEPIYLEYLEMMRVGRGRRAKVRPLSLRLPPLRPADRDERCGSLRLHESPGDLAFFTNGWQSWGYAGVLGREDRFPRTRFGPLTRPMRVNAGTPQPRGQGRFASDMFAALGDRKSRQGLAAGFLAQQQAFGSLEADLDPLEPRLRMWANADGIRLDHGDTFTTDWACLQPFGLDEIDPLAPYLEAVAAENQARVDGPVPVGWCSWYQYFGSVTQEDVLENLEWAAMNRRHVPLGLIQIDDGFQQQVGDWFSFKGTFPDGVQDLAHRARDAGFQAGLWLAPLIVRPGAKINKEHPQWLLRGKSGRPVQAGFEWDSFTRALDVTHPEVLEHLQRLMDTAVNEWGFEYLKLDFLYAGALQGVRHDPKVTRAQALRHALAEMRRAAGPDTALSGCGCPLGSGIGIFDAMRISADVASGWRPAYRGIEFPFRAEPDLPAVRNAIRNTITRAPLHGKWWVNDPDCLLMGSQSRRLSEAEVQCLATTIALSAGSMIVSDALPSLDASGVEWLAKLLPPLPKQARALDWFDSAYPARLILPLSDETGDRHLVAFLNWSDRPFIIDAIIEVLPLPHAGVYHAVDFWGARYLRLHREADATLQIPPHGVRFLALREAGEEPAWVGDTLHVSQGMAVRRWRIGPGTVKAALDLGRQAEGTIWCSLPSQPSAILLNGSSCDWRRAGQDVYEFDASFEGKAELVIKWN